MILSTETNAGNIIEQNRNLSDQLSYIIVRLFKFKTRAVEGKGMSLKQHNDIVQKLLKQVDAKDKQIEGLKKQLNKAACVQTNSQFVSTKTIQTQKQVNKKIGQLHKQYKEKLGTLTQQIRNKSVENKDLKQRLNKLKNIEAKQKQQTAEILKKIGQISAHDPKFAAVVSHYQSVIQNKNKYVAELQKQIKQQFYDKNTKNRNNTNSNEYKINDKNCNSLQNQSETSQEQGIQNSRPANQNQGMNNYQKQYHSKYQQQIKSLKVECNKYQRLFQQKSKQFKDLSKRYSDLTKEYYKIMNQYQCPNPKSTIKEDVGEDADRKQRKAKNNILQNMIDRFDEQRRLRINPENRNQQFKSQNSLQFSFLSEQTKTRFQNRQRSIANFNDDDDADTQLGTIQNIMELFGITNRLDLLPTLTKLKINNQQCQAHQNISRYVHSMLYRFGMGKIPMSQIIQQLNKFQIKINKYIQDSELMGEVCIEAGAKKQKLIQKIKDYKATQQQFFTNLKNMDFMQKLPKANKIIQFIEYFQLDKQICELPQQLKKMYQQLKYVDRFLKQSYIILQKQPQGLQRSLQSILRFLERKTAQQMTKGQQRSKKN